MADAPSLKYGILKVEDLVALYFGARMRTNIQEIYIGPVVAASGKLVVLGPDPRRIKYEIFIAAAIAGLVELGSPAAVQAAKGQIYGVALDTTTIIERTWIGDMDAVTMPVSLLVSSGAMVVTARAVYLTPIPVDQAP